MDKNAVENMTKSIKLSKKNQKVLESRLEVFEDRFVDVQSSITENWNQAGHTKADQLKGNDKIKELDIKIDILEKAIKESVDKIKLLHDEALANQIDKERQHLIVEEQSWTKSCKICNESFDRSWKLEHHMKQHPELKQFNCETCGKAFSLEWRLRKHITIHDKTNRRKCHYFNNNQECPFQSVGCMFIHDDSKECDFGRTCSRILCHFKHTKDTFKENLENPTTMDKKRHDILPNDEYESKVAEENNALDEALEKIDNLLENKKFLESRLTMMMQLIREKEERLGQ